MAAVVLLVRYTKQSEYLRACIARKIRGVVTVDQGDVRALLSGAKDDSANLEGEEPVEAPPIEVVETQASEQKEEVDDDADDPFESKCYSLGDRNAALVCIPGRDFSFAARLWERYVEREKQAAKKRQHEEKKAKEKAARDEKLRKKDPVAADKKRAREEAKQDAKKKPRTSGTVGIIFCVEINQCVGCTRQFFTKSFLGDDAADLARSSGEEPASPRHRAGVASMAWRTTR